MFSVALTSSEQINQSFGEKSDDSKPKKYDKPKVKAKPKENDKPKVKDKSKEEDKYILKKLITKKQHQKKAIQKTHHHKIILRHQQTINKLIMLYRHNNK